MSIRANRFILFGAALAMTMPVWAAPEDTASVSFDHTMTVAGTPIQPGNYEFKVKSNDVTVQILRSGDNRLIARVKGKWVVLNSKPQQTEVLINEDAVQGIDFGGKTEAIRFTRDPGK